jgi:membrane-associated phospholipid phosphatase
VGVLGGGFVALATAVHAGALEPFDRLARSQLAPLRAGLEHRGRSPVTHGLASSTDALLVPAAPVAAAVLVAAGCAVLLHRRRRAAAAAWAAALVAGLAAEVAAKAAVDTATGETTRVLGVVVESSFPSGHVMRAVLLAGLAAALWPAVQWVAAGWAGAVCVAMQLTGAHQASDIAGGVALGLALVVAVHAATDGVRPRRRLRRVQPAAAQPRAVRRLL